MHHHCAIPIRWHSQSRAVPISLDDLWAAVLELMQLSVPILYRSSHWHRIGASFFPPPSNPSRYFLSILLSKYSLNAFNVFHPSELSHTLGFPIILGGPEPEHKAQKVKEGKYLYGPEKPESQEVKKWLLLLEVGSHSDTGMSWWDAGYFQYLIHQDDLDSLDFSRCYANIQTS